MSRLLKILIALLITLFIALVIIWTMLPVLVSKELSKQAKVPISMDALQLSLSNIHIEKLKVGNPPFYTLPKALTVDTIEITAPLSRYFDPQITLDRLTLDNIYVGLEFDSKNSKQGNWSTIMGHLNGSDPQNTSKNVLIKKLILTNLSIELAYKDASSPPKKLQKITRIELDHVSSEGGIPSSVIMKIVMREALHNIFSKEGLQNMIQDAIQNRTPSGAGALFKGLFSDAVPN